MNIPIGTQHDPSAPWNEEEDTTEYYSICRECGAYITLDAEGNQIEVEGIYEEHSGSFIDKCVACYIEEIDA